MRKSHRLGTAVLLVLGLAALSSVPATALDDKKPDVGCAGLAFEDPKGDAVDGATFGLASGNDNEDVTGGWFKYDGAVATANIRIANLDKTVPDDATDLNYYMEYTIGTDMRYVSATLSGGEPTFAYGDFDGNVFNDVGPTKGKFFTGQDGVIQMELPARDSKPNFLLQRPYAHVGRVLLAVVFADDDGPDDTTKGHNYAVGGCTDGGEAVAAPGGKKVTQATLPLLLPSSLGSAKKASKAKAIIIKVKAKTTVTSVKLSLATAAGKVVGTGSAAKVSGNGKIKLKLKGKVKAGNYVLTATGTAGGKKGTTSRKAKLSK